MFPQQRFLVCPGLQLLINFPTKGPLERRSSPCVFQMVASISIQSFLIINSYTRTDRCRVVKQFLFILARTELVNDREKEIVDDHKSKLEVKMSKISENKERMARRKLRSLKFQDKKRQLARKRVSGCQCFQNYSEQISVLIKQVTVGSGQGTTELWNQIIMYHYFHSSTR